MSNTAEARELGWDDPIENESPEFVTLPEGDYNFDVVDFERARHAGSEKLPPCNKAIVHIRIEGEEGVTTIRHNLFLHTKTEGMLCAFFTAIGQRQKGEKFDMNWSKVKGATGRCRISVRKWTGDDGVERTNNEIKRFYESAEKAQAGFQPGKF